ncbi:MAG: cupin domain-containing protein [Streptosporangiales bacterium]|nr:cupin domain-containing protein [Streptosporangiales bacterium]
MAGKGAAVSHGGGAATGAATGAEQPRDGGDEERASDLSQVIGHHVRTFRTELGLSLRALAERSGLSIGFLSQLERGLSSISLTALRDLADTMGRDITEFFDETAVGSDPVAAEEDATEPAARDSEQPVSPKRYFTLMRAGGEQSSQYVSGQRTYRMLSKRAPELVLEPMLVHIAPGGELDEMETHAGEEFAYVLEGELVYTVDGTAHRLGQGDSLHLKSSIPHSLHNDTDSVTVVVSVVTPRLF